MKATKITNDDDEDKEENSQHQDGNESLSMIKRLMSMNFKQNVIFVIDIVTSCGEKMI